MPRRDLRWLSLRPGGAGSFPGEFKGRRFRLRVNIRRMAALGVKGPDSWQPRVWQLDLEYPPDTRIATKEGLGGWDTAKHYYRELIEDNVA